MFSETHDMNRAFRVTEHTAETGHTPKRVSLSIATRECEHFDTILQRQPGWFTQFSDEPICLAAIVNKDLFLMT